MYCRGAAAVILTYDVTNWQSLAELENRFLSLTDTANTDCIFALWVTQRPYRRSRSRVRHRERAKRRTSSCGHVSDSSRHSASAQTGQQRGRRGPVRPCASLQSLEEKACLPAERMCFETSALKTGYNVDALFETLFELVLPSILKKRSEGESATVGPGDAQWREKD